MMPTFPEAFCPKLRLNQSIFRLPGFGNWSVLACVCDPRNRRMYALARGASERFMPACARRMRTRHRSSQRNTQNEDHNGHIAEKTAGLRVERILRRCLTQKHAK